MSWGRRDERGPDLAERSQALSDAIEIGGARLDPQVVERARTTARKIGERAALGSGYTVVALAGATGSGKSSLFNALVGAEVAQPGVRRPTTSTATAAIWGPGSARELLDWLGVGARHQVDQSEGPRDGLVLLDLPDFDSRERRNRAEADRVLQLADVFVWVTDPQKYADAVIHDEYIKALSAHDAKTVVVLNQADRLTVDQVEQTTRDLKRLVESDGVRDVTVMPTSARSGAGVDRLAGRLLGREVLRGADDGVGHRQLVLVAQRLVDDLGDPEVEDLDGAVGGIRDVAGLDVAVDDSRVVSRLQRSGHLDADRPHVRHGERPLVADLFGQGRSRQQLHDEVGRVVLDAGVVDGDDVGVVEAL